ncbi:hypothetical protein GQ44DRAFT_768646 [Phaeosphaeriaceae sp. PMI808]|nr:hypothetical protein GQ44DRAFT_768646 [Phaeosphaeriaceae sp. PMI808]
MTKDFYIPSDLLREKAYKFTEIFLPPVPELPSALMVNITGIASFSLFVDWLQMPTEVDVPFPRLNWQDNARLLINTYIFSLNYNIEGLRQMILLSLSTCIAEYCDWKNFCKYVLQEIKYVYLLSFTYDELRSFFVNKFCEAGFAEDDMLTFEMWAYPEKNHFPQQFADDVREAKSAQLEGLVKKREKV